MLVSCLSVEHGDVDGFDFAIQQDLCCSCLIHQACSTSNNWSRVIMPALCSLDLRQLVCRIEAVIT